jgi:hypothetical protein
MTMKSKQYVYAAVGAPVAVAKVAQSRVGELRVKLNEGKVTLTKDLQKQLESWATEGEQLVGKIGDSKAIDEITERVDLDQVQEQVSKLRDQLEDLLDTWRANFRPAGKPEKVSGKIEVEVTDAKAPAAKTTAARTTAARSTAAKTTAARSTAAKKPAAKTTAAKTTATKKPAAKSTATKAS